VGHEHRIPIHRMVAKKYLSTHIQCPISVCEKLLQIMNTVFTLILFFRLCW